MSSGVVALTLAAALLHALWNSLAHSVTDRLVNFALMGVSWTLICAVIVGVVGLPPTAAWSFIGVSAALHVAYNLLLLVSYQLGDFSQMYPIARGTSPWLVAVVTLVLGQSITAWQLVGVSVISAGLLALGLRGERSIRERASALGAALVTGVAIAAYTIVDARGIRHAPVATYAAWMFLVQGPVIPLIALGVRRRALARISWRVVATGLGGGTVALTAYGLVLIAQRSGATAVIAALRETSIVFAAIIGVLVFREHAGRTRILAAATVVAGIAITVVR